MTFVYEHIVTGGIETLILRIGKAVLKQGGSITVVASRISNEMHTQLESANFKIIIIEKWRSKDIGGKLEAEKAFFFSPMDFFRVSSWLAKARFRNNCYLYIVHPYALKFVMQSKKLPILNAYLKKATINVLSELIRTGHIYFMDSMCLEECKRFCGFEFKCNSGRILHLPLDKDSPDETYNVVTNKEYFQILTISRAEYPFKGYVKGLMEELSKLHRKIFLQIISYGDGANDLKNWVERYRTDFLSIDLKGETSYEELGYYYKKCDLYVGMGTTVLEAASRYKVCIPVKPYTYELKARHYFHENPEVCAELAEESDGIDLICKFYDLDVKTRTEYQLSSYAAYERLYSMDVFLSAISEKEIDKFSYFMPRLLGVLFDVRRIKNKADRCFK